MMTKPVSRHARPDGRTAPAPRRASRGSTARVALVALMLLAVVLAGCSQGGPPATPQDGPVIEDAEGNRVVDEAPSNETAETASGKKVAANKGVIFGRVHDDFNFSLQGAFVTVVNTEHFTETDERGDYTLTNVPVGTFDVRFEMEGFKVLEKRVQVKAAKEVHLDAELAPLQPRSAGFNPHVHDFWAGSDVRTIMDHDLSLNEDLLPSGGTIRGMVGGPQSAVQCGVQRCTTEFWLPEQEDEKPATIWPGTKEIRITLSWDGATLVIPGAEIEYEHPGAGDPAVTDAVQSGETVSIPVAPEMQDHGHALWSQWRFWLATLNDAAGADVGVVSGKVHVKMELVRGDVVLDPPHPDYWQGRDALKIGNWDWNYWPNTGLLPTTQDSTDAHHVFQIHRCPPKERDAGECTDIVPPGTSYIEVYFEWLEGTRTGEDAPFSYSLTYRTPGQHPAHTDLDEFGEPEVVDEDLDESWRLYRIDLDSDGADPFYHKRSTWAFKWYQDHDLPVNVAQNDYKMLIQITAYK